VRGAVAVAAGLVALALAGCGDKDGAGGSGGPAQTVERVTTVEVARGPASRAFDAAAIYARDSPGVVTVFSVLGASTSAAHGGEGDEGVGSGFVLDGSGEIATNAHVVTDGSGGAIHEAKDVYVAFADGNEVSAKIVGFDPNADVALLKIDPAGLTLRPLALGTVQGLRVGSSVAAIGSPFGEPQSLSVGVVSAINRSIESLTGFQIAGAIQTDAAINHGNSGGPLVDAAGDVIGINSQIQSSSGGGEGVGYAISADTVRRTIAALRKDGRVQYAYLGVTTARIYPQLARRYKLPVSKGAWVQDVVPGGPAAKAGVHAGTHPGRFQARTITDGGDIITAVNDHPLDDDAALGVALLHLAPGDEIVLRVYRDGQPRDIHVTLGKRPQEASAGALP
jgi:S1-C subfamily serine protease